MPSASRIAHAGLPFANPMSPAAVDAAARALPLRDRACVLETGCGDGAVLARVLMAHPSARGLGIDRDADAISVARTRDHTGRARFRTDDAAAVTGRFDAVVNVAASHAHGGFPAALSRIGAITDVALYGEGFWRREPSLRFLDALGGATADELTGLDGLRDAVGAAGFQIMGEAIAGDEDWAHYEETLAANAERAGGRDCLSYARRIRERRALPDGTDTLGFALLVLGR